MLLDFRGVTAIYGRPGVGKTSLAMRIAHERVARGERVLRISLYEDRDVFVKNAASLGYDLSKVEFWDMIFVKTDVVFNQIVSAVSQNDYSLVVVDSISSLVEGIQSREYLINAVYRVFRPAKIDFVGIAEEESVTPLDYIADNLLRLELRIGRNVTERLMYVIKSRGRRAGYTVEFDIIEGQGVVFLDDLPRPAPRAAWEADTEALPPPIGPVRGGRIYLFVGSGFTPLLAKVAADLSRNGRKVLYRVFGRSTISVEKLVEKYGGKAVVQSVEPRPQSHFAHMKNLYDSLTETDADVVVSDGIDVEFFIYGRKAFELNKTEFNELRRLGIAALISTYKDRGLGAIADVTVQLHNGEAFLTSPEGGARCRYEVQPLPRLVCNV
jgi:KaiC/GvpD/RAD55 family RecA-like ATPase